MARLLDYLSPEQLEQYKKYQTIKQACWAQGSHQWQRLFRASHFLEPFHTDYRIVWEDGGPAKVTAPSPSYMAAAIHGGILGSLDARLSYKILLIGEGGFEVCTAKDAHQVRRDRNIKSEYVVDYSDVHLTRAGPRTEEQAIEDLVQTVLPAYLWEKRWNRPKFKICTVNQLPKSREHRSAWRLGERSVVEVPCNS